MDKNLQQFNSRYLERPFRLWGVVLVGLFLGHFLVVATTLDSAINEHLGSSIASLVSLFFGLCFLGIPGLKNYFTVNTEKRRLKTEGFFLVSNYNFLAAQSKKYSSNAIEGLLYLFDEMKMSHTFSDSDGLERTIRYTVRFRIDPQQVHVGRAFYEWYSALVLRMDNQGSEESFDGLLAHLRKVRDTMVDDASPFFIEFPYVNTLPAIR